jgi:hypothetical protein
MSKGLLLVVFIIIGLFVGVLVFTNNLPSLSVNKPEINMNQKLQDELPGSYGITNYDWSVWSRTFKDSGGILTRANSWEDFKESFRQFPAVISIELDQNNHVVWFKGAINHAIYYQY